MPPAPEPPTAPPLERLPPDELRAIASLWRRTQREVLARFAGRSMEPTIRSGTEVLVRCGAEPAVGDVVAFLKRGRLVVHRLVATAAGGAWWLTRGDAHALPDVPLPSPADFIGVVARVREGETMAPVPPPPSSPAARAVLAATTAALRLSPTLARALVRVLLVPRFTLGMLTRKTEDHRDTETQR